MELDFAQVLEANQNMVFSLALRFVRDRAVAEELAQEVFLKCYRQFDRIESEAHATWWLRRAICHRSIDETRKRKLRPEVDIDKIPEPKQGGPAPDFLLHNFLRKLIQSLPEKARMVVVLRYGEDRDPGEIAEMLDMPLSSVKSTLHRAIVTLRSKFQKQEVLR